MKGAHILLVEDNEGDVILTQEALSDAAIEKISVARDGEEAINHLNSALHNSDEQLPDLILLDINLPKIDGKEVLQYIKKTATLKRIPVVMLSTSSSEFDINDAYSNCANCFISKPVDLNRFCDVVKMIEGFWINTVKLPTSN